MTSTLALLLMLNIPSNLIGPLKLFVKELESHIEFFQSSLEPTELSRKQVEGRFHLIKGSAGFFKLDRIRELAARFESEFKAAKERPTEIPRLIEELPTTALPLLLSELGNIRNELTT